jgi:hypothetical protein
LAGAAAKHVRVRVAVAVRRLLNLNIANFLPILRISKYRFRGSKATTNPNGIRD